ncbi:MAG: D-alanine--D-alanine ligase [Chloroflexi bacterium]|nr:D-alanine--D-alanine ligase [Chloroflexota bacterium]MBK6713151.1 D-alanine--D-alanine ligase [Chloroflexota bacterium]MBK7176774.1 D-alanine--D-alanine ligase [Chloroflexota bacterium]MBK7918144.1 D-alanine--D-alanine ligase [Chloroflexota bacterium]MBK8932316.1 D-alanine--D-alanine ligase [Chloroflexota bacterium]
MHVALLANLQKNAPLLPGMSSDMWDDLDSEKTIEAITAALESGGHKVTFLEGDSTLFDNVRRLKPDICFNICEGHFGDSREAQVPAILEMLRIPYTGSQVLTLALTLDKPMTKRVLTYHGLPTPQFQVFERIHEPINDDLVFPLFVKPSREGTGMGISADSVVQNEEQLRTQLRRLFDRYDQPVLAEHFIEGREITVGVVGNLTTPVAWRLPEDEEAPRVSRGLYLLPPLEIDMTRYPDEEGGIYTSRIKTELAHEFHYLCPAPIDDDMLEELNWLTAATFRVTGCQDVARVDFRLDANDGNKPYILEINPLPGLNPEYSDLCIEARAEGWTYEELVNRILNEATERYGL